MNIRHYFSQLGLDEDIADLYIALCAHGAQTISQLSRSSGVERTRIYRLLEELKKSQLIEVEVHYKREILKAAPPTNLQILVAKKEQEANNLRTALPEMYKAISQYEQSSAPTRVQFYKGTEGIKQMMWNETRATTEVLCILNDNMQHKTGASFFDRWVERCNERNLHHRGVVSSKFMDEQHSWYASRHNERLANWTQRHIDPKLFPITHSTIIYDDVVNYYNWKEGEIFGIEIYNQEIATTQRHLFELLWQSAKHLEDVQTTMS